MGESEAEKDASRSSDLGRQFAIEGIGNLEDIAERFRSDPLFESLRPLAEQIINDPLTFNEATKQNITSGLQGTLERAADAQLGQFGGLAESLGVSRSSAGGAGLANLTNLAANAQQAKALQDVEILAARQRIPDLQNALSTGFGFLQNTFQPERELALGQLGSLQGFSSLANANANLSSTQTGPLDFLGGVLGAASGGLLGNESLF